MKGHRGACRRGNEGQGVSRGKPEGRKQEGGGAKWGGEGKGGAGGKAELGGHRVLLAPYHRSEPVTDQDSFEHFDFAAELAHQADLCPGIRRQLDSHTEGVQRPPRFGNQLAGICLLRGQMPATAWSQKPGHLHCQRSVLTSHSAIPPSASQNSSAEGAHASNSMDTASMSFKLQTQTQCAGARHKCTLQLPMNI